MLRDQGKLDEAIPEYRKATLLEPKLAGTHGDLGLALLAKGELDEALAECKKTIELVPQFAGAHTNLGMVLRKKGLVDEAIAEYQKAIELDPKAAGPHHNLGNALHQKGSLDEAIAEWKKEIDLNPKNVDSHIGLGTVLRGKGRVDEAIAEWRKVVELAPKNADAHYELGQALKSKGYLAEAIAAFENVIQGKPDFSAAHFALASALADANQWDRSASVYAAALKRFGAEQWPGPGYEAIRSNEVFTRLTAQQPDDRLPRIMRARLRVFERDWKHAAAEYARVYESLASIDPAKLPPEGGDDLFCYGSLLLLLGDRDGYERFCKTWADRVGDAPAWRYDLALRLGGQLPPASPRAADRRAGQEDRAG